MYTAGRHLRPLQAHPASFYTRRSHPCACPSALHLCSIYIQTQDIAHGKQAAAAHSPAPPSTAPYVLHAATCSAQHARVQQIPWQHACVL